MEALPDSSSAPTPRQQVGDAVRVAVAATIFCVALIDAFCGATASKILASILDQPPRRPPLRSQIYGIQHPPTPSPPLLAPPSSLLLLLLPLRTLKLLPIVAVRMQTIDGKVSSGCWRLDSVEYRKLKISASSSR